MQCWQRNAAATLLGSRVAARLRAACAAACNPRSLAARPARPLCARAQQPRARRPAAAAVAAGTAGHCLQGRRPRPGLGAAAYFGSRGSRTPARPARGACCGLGGLGSAASTAAMRSCMSSSSSLSVWHRNWNEYHRTCAACGAGLGHAARRQRGPQQWSRLEQAARCMRHGARPPQRRSFHIVTHGLWGLVVRDHPERAARRLNDCCP